MYEGYCIVMVLMVEKYFDLKYVFEVVVEVIGVLVKKIKIIVVEFVCVVFDEVIELDCEWIDFCGNIYSKMIGCFVFMYVMCGILVYFNGF